MMPIENVTTSDHKTEQLYLHLENTTGVKNAVAKNSALQNVTTKNTKA